MMSEPRFVLIHGMEAEFYINPAHIATFAWEDSWGYCMIYMVDGTKWRAKMSLAELENKLLGTTSTRTHSQ